MTTPTWHLYEAREYLEGWYAQMNQFLELAKGYGRIPLCKASAYECKRQALKCKTLGLIFHDRSKLLLDKCWRN